MVSAIYLLHGPSADSGISPFELLLQRDYDNDLPDESLVLANFHALYQKLKPEERTPFMFSNGISYIYIKADHDIYLMAVSRHNVNAMSAVTFLHNFYKILFHYLCIKKPEAKHDNFHHQTAPSPAEQTTKSVLKLDKDVIIDNFVLIYELLDECIDFGIVQLTDFNILKEYIKIEANRARTSINASHDQSRYDLTDSSSDDEDANKKWKKERKSKAQKKIKNVKSTRNHAVNKDVLDSAQGQINSSVLRTSASGISWRPKGIFYAKNEIYIDIIEKCEFYMDLSTDIVKQNEVHGTCIVKSHLSGMPSCKIGFNEQNISRIGNDEDYGDESAFIEDSSARPDNQLKILEKDDDEDEDTESISASEVGISSKTKRPHRVPIRNVQFHQCIQLGSIYKDNLIYFIPPDDKFALLSYHVEQQKQRRKQPLIIIKPTYRIHQSTNKLQVLCVLSTNFKKRLHCNNLIIYIPINPSLFSVKYDAKSMDDDLKYKSELGDVSYKVDSSEILWNIDTVNGAKKSVKMMAELSLNSTSKIADLAQVEASLYNKPTRVSHGDSDSEDVDPRSDLDRYYGVNGASASVFDRLQKKLRHKDHNHISVSFSIPMLTYSGLKLTYLRVDEEKMKYTCFPWVRYVTQSESSQEDELSSTDSQHCNYRFKLGTKCFQYFQ